jgi:hypothetical protein
MKTHFRTSTIIDCLLTIISMMGWHRCHAQISLKWLLSLRALIMPKQRHIDDKRYKTNNCWPPTDAHIDEGAGYVLLLFLPRKAATTSLLNACKNSPLKLPRYRAKDCWHSIDADFQNEAATMSLPLLPMMAATMMIMQNNVHITIQLY